MSFSKAFSFQQVEPAPGVSPLDWNSWTWQMRSALRTQEDFSKYIQLTEGEQLAFASAQDVFRIQSNPYYAALVATSASRESLRRMLLPQSEELDPRGLQLKDPLAERKYMVAPRLVHRYPDRVLFWLTDQCGIYCRYCLRKHFTATDQAFVNSDDYQKALSYLSGAKGVREVILSGGDALLLSDTRLAEVLLDLRRLSHIEIIRVATRLPVVNPMRITNDLCLLLRQYKPVVVMTHFNHPAELTTDSAAAVERLVDHGIPVYNQMVLLNGVNNHAAVVQALQRRLLWLRVNCYYLFQCDPSPGVEHLRTSVGESLAIQQELFGRLSGLAMPRLSLDIPGGGGKVSIGGANAAASATCSGAYEFLGWDGVRGHYKDPLPEYHRLPPDLELYLPEWDRLKNQRYGGT